MLHIEASTFSTVNPAILICTQRNESAVGTRSQILPYENSILNKVSSSSSLSVLKDLAAAIPLSIVTNQHARIERSSQGRASQNVLARPTILRRSIDSYNWLGVFNHRKGDPRRQQGRKVETYCVQLGERPRFRATGTRYHDCKAPEPCYFKAGCRCCSSAFCSTGGRFLHDLYAIGPWISVRSPLPSGSSGASPTLVNFAAVDYGLPSIIAFFILTQIHVGESRPNTLLSLIPTPFLCLQAGIACILPASESTPIRRPV